MLYTVLLLLLLFDWLIFPIILNGTHGNLISCDGTKESTGTRMKGTQEANRPQAICKVGAKCPCHWLESTPLIYVIIN